MNAHFTAPWLVARSCLCVITSVLFPLLGGAQSIPLNGVVVIQNSQYETGQRIYVTDASIRAPLAKPATTGKQGTFALEFAGVRTGTPVRLAVSKPGLEVVNTKDVGQVILGRVPEVQVVMADPDKLAAAQLKYYNIATESITGSYERRMTALRSENKALEERLSEVNAETGRTVQSLSDAIDLLTKQREEGFANAMGLAQQFAEVNLDDASVLYRQAYEAFQRGQLDSVLSILDAGKLREAYERVNEEKAKAQDVLTSADKTLLQLFESYRLKEQVLESTVRYKEARGVMNEMVAMVRAHPTVFGPAARTELNLFNGNLWLMTGDPAQALIELQNAWEEGEKALPKEHLLLCSVQRIMGTTFRAMGRYDEGLEAVRKSIAIGEAALGVDNDQLAVNYNALGLVLGSLGKDSAAYAETRHALLIAGRDTVRNAALLTSIHSNLGSWLEGMGRPAEALQEALRAMEMAKRVLPPDHPSLVACYHNLSNLYEEKGLIVEAQDASEKALAMTFRSLGAEHPDLVQIHYGMANVLKSQGDYRGAIARFERALTIRQRITGPDDDIVIMLQSSIGVGLAQLNSFDSALVHFRASLASYNRMLPAGDPGFHETYTVLGGCFDRMGLLDSARHYNELALECVARGQGLHGPLATGTYWNMALMEHNAGSRKAAVGYYEKCLANQEELYGPNSPNVGKTLERLAPLYLNNDQPDSAWACVQKLKERLDPALAGSDPNAAALNMVMGGFMRFQGDGDSAVACYRSAYGIYSKLLGPKAYQTRTALQNIGYTLGTLDMPDSAIHYLEQCEQVYLVGMKAGNAPELDALRVGIAWNLARLGHLDSALAICQRQLPLQQRRDGSWTSRAGTTHMAIGWILERKGDLRNALIEYKVGFTLDSRAASSRSWGIARDHYYIGRTLFALADPKAARNALESSAAVIPTKDVKWFLYRIAADKHDEAQALEHLAAFQRCDHWDFGTIAMDEQVVRKELKGLATKLHRQDVLDEFELN